MVYHGCADDCFPPVWTSHDSELDIITTAQQLLLFQLVNVYMYTYMYTYTYTYEL